MTIEIPPELYTVIYNQTIDRVLRFIANWETETGELPTTETVMAYLKGLRI